MLIRNIFLASGIALFTALGLIGCSGKCIPKTLPSQPEGTTYLINDKRYAKRMNIDYLYRFRSKAYRLPPADLYDKSSEDQSVIFESFGMPDAVRRSFKSNRNEKTDEWIYVYADRMFQFVCGRLVYEGPITDHEMLLMVHGYPNQVMRSQLEPDQESMTFIYKSRFLFKTKQFVLYNDTIRFRQESK